MGADPGLLGTTVSDRYHLVRLLGDGGMGAVYKAGDRVLRRFVALKLLHRKAASTPRTVERFAREARAAAGIGHPNIIDILDFGYEQDRPFLVMEYLRGRSLSQVLANEGPLDVERACRIATHTLAGLAAAHEHAILHRDLKPANLMLVAHLGDKDFVKVCDFGFATLMSPQEHIAESGKTLTPERTLVGTPSYAAPERLRGDDRRDPRIDIWSMGVVLFEMLTGARPFQAPTFKDLVRKIRRAEPPTMRSFRRELPPELDRVVSRALAKDPEGRWPTAQAFAEALVPFGGRRVELDARDDTEKFSMDLLRVRARETARWRALVGSDADAVLRATADEARSAEPREEEENAPTERDPEPEPGSSLRRLTRPVSTSGPDADAGEEDPDDVDTQVAPPSTAAPVSREVASAAPDEPEPAYEATVVLSILRFVSREFGERALKDVLDGLPAPAREVFASGVAAESWVPWYAVAALIQEVDARLGRDDLHLIAQCGRAAAEGVFDRVRTIKPPTPPPELLLAEMPTVTSLLLRGMQWRVHHVGRGYGRLEVAEREPASLPTCVWSLGFLEESLDRTGAKEVEVNLTSCRALGDPSCILDVTWL